MTRRFRILSALAYNDPLYHQGIMEFAHDADWELNMSVSYYGSEPSNWKGDGIITHYLSTRPDLMDWIRRQRVPIVSINADEVPFWPGTAPNHGLCGQMAAEYFFSLGLNNLAFFRCSDQISVVQRQEAFRKETERRGGTFHLLDWRESPSKNRTTKKLTTMLAKLPVPSGILSQSDHRTTLLFNACEEAKRFVPEEIAILGVGNNSAICNFSRVPLSSVDTDMKRIAWEGAAMLDSMLRGGKVPKTPVFFPPIGLAVRQSTTIARNANDSVAKALRFIIQNVNRPINAEDVVKHVGLSRSWLSRLFMKHVGSGIAEEILRIRIQEAKYLLAASEKSIAEIAKEVGFTSYVHFAKSFQRSIGCSAKEYIKKLNTGQQ